jgi:hypothetical protein
MKRPLALMFALTLLAAFAAHTAHAATNVHFGVLAGAGFAKMRMDNDAASNLGNFTAPAIGVTARIEIARSLDRTGADVRERRLLVGRSHRHR